MNGKDAHGWRMKPVFAAHCCMVAFVNGQALFIYPTVLVSYNADCLTLELGRPCSVNKLSSSTCHPSHSLSLTKKKSIPLIVPSFPEPQSNQEEFNNMQSNSNATAPCYCWDVAPPESASCPRELPASGPATQAGCP